MFESCGMHCGYVAPNTAGYMNAKDVFGLAECLRTALAQPCACVPDFYACQKARLLVKHIAQCVHYSMVGELVVACGHPACRPACLALPGRALLVTVSGVKAQQRCAMQCAAAEVVVICNGDRALGFRAHVDFTARSAHSCTYVQMQRGMLPAATHSRKFALSGCLDQAVRPSSATEQEQAAP